MPYQPNYAENIGSITTGGLTKIEETIFRFATPDDEIISTIIGDNQIGLDDTREFVELHFYDRNTNQLIQSVVTPFSEGFLYVRDRSSRRHGATAGAGGGAYGKSIQLGLEFWNPEKPENSLYEKYLNNIPSGTYNVIINFFSDEIGTYNDLNWKIAEISNSRRELILEPLATTKVDSTQFEQFASNSIFVTDFKLMMIYLFEKYKSNNNYDIIINKFFDVLKTMDKAAYDHIFVKNSRSYQTDLRNTLKTVIDGVYGDLVGSVKVLPDGVVTKGWADAEASANRFRITENKFEKALQQSIHDNLKVKVTKFPEATSAARIFHNK